MVVALIVALLLLAGREWLAHEERKAWTAERQQLLDRIQSKDYAEYKTMQRLDKPKTEKKEKAKPPNFL